jgi:ubiquitin carboxyl-terminal hydrolase 34
LSVTVKDIKSLHESLQKLIEGEVINDYDCDNCKKKVDISRRQLLSSAPNVLIVHLQRMCFNFETFRNDKINSFFDFPLQLDLKPYSFYEVMRKEGRLKKQGEDGEEGEAEQKPEQDADNPWPEEEQCFEYKLVGVEVHSGSANAGHYWSLINTKRGVEEPDESDPNWNKSESDPWMKFNDSSVTEYNPEKLREDCFGGDGRSGESDSWSFGGSYGQSAYMLVYEKKLKRPLKILASPEDVEKNKEKLEFDEKKEEHYKLINYRDIVEDVAPNKIYKQVYEENYKLDFENDIYSSEFFEFIR